MVSNLTILITSYVLFQTTKILFIMAANVNDDVITLHNTMVFDISTEIFEETLEVVKELFRGKPLTSVDMSKIKNIPTLFKFLMNYETIGYGDYQKFVSVIRYIHPRICSMIQECAVKINKLKGNLDDQGDLAAMNVTTANTSYAKSKFESCKVAGSVV
ncbi:uncharacterized protein LOC110459380 [Mizuhopecten yessoensis]|uniref:uncharacterized protein LOC110459380 n=1 Tax=Mizuhopecten yessoensis TaxID=6573 RepID=UPI000B45B9C9|nr:uncharacterized protein LOC110459380 [Mizuhopecten yessoensis]